MSLIVPPASLPLGPPVTPLVEELQPAPEPWQAFQALVGLPHLLFLDSALAHPEFGRYSFLSADPSDWLAARETRVWSAAEGRVQQPADPFAVLAARLDRWQTQTLPDLPPFQGGAAGMFGYDLC